MSDEWLRTGVGTSDADSMTLMGRDVPGELMGHVTLTELAFLLVQKRLPTPEQSRLLDAVLISLPPVPCCRSNGTPTSYWARLPIRFS